MRQAAVCAGLTAALVAFDARRAEACTCATELLVLPAHEAQAVPTNLSEILISPRGSSVTFELRHAGTQQLVPTGPATDLWGSLYPRLTRTPLLAALDANTTYELAIVDDMGATTTTFTTGPAADLVPPGAVTVSDLAVAHAIYQPPVLSSCGEDLTSFRGVVAGLADVATLGIRFTGANAVQERVVFARETPLLLLGMGHCNIRLDVVPGETYDVEVWARDLAGNSGPIYREQITVRACAPVPMYYDFDFDLNDCPLADDESDGGGCAAGGPGAAPWLAVIGLGWLIRRRRARSKR